MNELITVGKAFNVLGVRHTTRVFLIWRVRGRASAITHLSHPCLVSPFFNIMHEMHACC